MPERKLRVFLCHASQDKPVVRELYQKLSTDGWIEPWLDEEKLLPGHDWDMEIEKAVESADAVIVCLSNNSVTKVGYVQRELRFVLDIALTKPEETIFVVPLRLEDCQPPRRLRAWQYADYFPLERRDWAYERLRKSLEIRANGLGILPAKPAAEMPKPPAEEKCPPMMSVVEPLVLVREDKPVGRTGSPTYADHLTLNGNAPGFLGMEFRRVPAGKFLMGSADSDTQAYDREKPQHSIDIPYDYWLARFPVTNEQYSEYAKAAGTTHPVSDWQQKKEHPVTRVSWEDAMAYCKWLNELLKGKWPQNYVLRLPTEAEWKKAARGSPLLLGEGSGVRVYPWGVTFDANKCNISESGIGGTTPMGKYSPQGDSPHGCADMSGNVWEWTHSLFKPYPYWAGDGREAEKASGSRVLRGGSWVSDAGDARCACRGGRPSLSLSGLGGFRVAVSVSTVIF